MKNWRTSYRCPTFSRVWNSPNTIPVSGEARGVARRVVSPGKGCSMDDRSKASLGPRSHRQAMDWSLVLVSQGIEPELLQRDAQPYPDLLVPAEELSRSLQILEQYQRENRHRRWQRPLPRTRILFDWQSLGWGALVCILFAFQMAEGSLLLPLGEFDSKRVLAGEWWRSVTATSLHADVRHLSSNVSTGLIFLSLAMVEYGAGQALLAMTVAGALANGVGLLMRPVAYHGLGASGAVMAALGLIAVRAFRFQEWRERPVLTTARGLIAGVLLLVLLGFSPQGDILVHVAGFVIGAVFGLLLSPFAGNLQSQSRWDLPCKAAFTLLVSVTWWLALKGQTG
ncbi:MAG: rhomboid family intramembrane serine protease [Verrucomicrobiales bacterium]|nr:rhomboid family intramembrane serine protease [Verrucomicrobiales bacterium]